MESAAAPALDVVRDLVPDWARFTVVWAELVCWTLGAWIVASGLVWLGSRAARRASSGGWHQVARAAFPYRVSLGLLQGGVALTWFFACLSGQAPLAPAARLAGIPAAVAALVVIVMWRLRLERRIGRTNFTAQDWARGQMLAVLVGFPHLGLAIVAGLLVSSEFDAATLGVLVAAVAAMVIAGWGGGLAVARLTGIIRPPSPRSVAALERAAERLGRPVPRIGEVSVSMANALVVFGADTVLVTRRALEVLDDEELVAVLRHELGHLAEPLRRRAVHLSGVFALIPVVAARPILATMGVNALLLIVAAAFLVTHLLVLPTLRRSEADADRFALGRGEGSAAFARALEAIHRENRIPAVLARGHGVHPHLYDRLIAADVTPAFPRPSPPRHALGVLLTVLGYGAFLACALGGSRAVPQWIGAQRGEQARLWSRAILEKSHPAFALHELARSVWESRGPAAATPFYAAAAELDESPWWPALAAHAAAANQRPGDAVVFLDEARARASAHGAGPWDDAVRAAADEVERAKTRSAIEQAGKR